MVDAIWPEELIEAAADAVSRYLYSDDCAHVAHLDTNEPNLCEFNTAALAALSKLSTFGSPIVPKKARRLGDINYSVVLCCRCIRVAVKSRDVVYDVVV